MTAQTHVIRCFEEYVLQAAGLSGQGSLEFEFEGQTARGYPYVRSAHEPFEAALVSCLDLMTNSPPDAAPRFLEVGCGIGTKCGIAQHYGVHVTGIDLLPAYVELARHIFPELDFRVANALDFDYGDFDLIFYHIPLANDALMFKLEQRVLSQMKVSGILFNTKVTAATGDSLRGNYRFRKLDIDAGRIVAWQKTA